MNKDVIYIDVEDDITTIIGKIKASKDKIIALVPPSRVGVLQSAVNMRLLQRAAEQAGKRVVLITHSQALMALAAAAQIPVARTLQSKPELIDAPVLKVDDDDIIDGEMLPVGDLADSASIRKTDDTAVDAAIASMNKKNITSGVQKKTVNKSKKSKIPNFSSFRKKMVLIGAGAVLLIAFLVWAIGFAPRATVVISAKTTVATVDKNVTLLRDGKTDSETGTLKVSSQEQKADLAVQFGATGKKEVGEKATGTVRLSSDSFSALLSGINIPAGTRLTSSSGKVYATNTAVTLSTSGASKTTGITAVESGTSFNGASGSMSGAPAKVSATITGGATSGGTDKTITVVSEEDVRAATDKLNEQKTTGLKEEVLKLFDTNSVVVINDSYIEHRGDATPSVAVGSEANGPVTLKATVTASMMAIDKQELSGFLTKSIEKEIDGKKSQKIYSNGEKDVKFAQFAESNDKFTVRITANGSVGPNIDESDIKDQVKGKKFGDIQQGIESIDGVNNVDVKFWPFWVSTVPNNPDRITVEFKLEDA